VIGAAGGPSDPFAYPISPVDTPERVSPRGNVAGGKPAEFTTKIERDAQGRPLTVTDPLTHTTKYTYDGDGNLETVTDGNSNKTKYTYNADNQSIKVEAPNKAVTETEYDGAGQVIAQTDGNKHQTKYVRNAVEEVTEVTDPLGHKTLKEYDGAGNLIKLTDPKSRTTTYTYDPANRLTEVSYSSGKPSTIKYEYDKNGNRTSVIDGTGTSKYTYDQLDRLTEAETGHKEKTKYEYDLANDKTKITYPNTKSVTRAFDKDGRLEKVTDWSSNITKFTYDPDSDLATIVFPAASKDEDKYAYNDADQMTEAKMLKSTESLASLVYTRDGDGQVKTTTSKGLPGEEKPASEYDANNRLTKGSVGRRPRTRGQRQRACEAVDQREGDVPSHCIGVTACPGEYNADAVDVRTMKQIYVLLGKTVGIAPHEIPTARGRGCGERRARRPASGVGRLFEKSPGLFVPGEDESVGDHVVPVGGPPAKLITPGIAGARRQRGALARFAVRPGVAGGCETKFIKTTASSEHDTA
jgi:YD repeat-containing protein